MKFGTQPGSGLLDERLTVSNPAEQTIELKEALRNFQKLKDLPPSLCMVCHKVHSADTDWQRLEEFFACQTDIMFSHGMCPDCVRTTYGKLGEKILARQNNTGEQKITERVTAAVREDESLKEMRALVERAAESGNPLTPDIEKMSDNHAKLLRRFYKIVSLSDTYQSQLREFNLRLELMAHTDPLTCINNRGYFMELLGIELERARRYERTFAIMMLDLDHFKTVNDTYGHAAGDEALRTLARVFHTSGLRKCDFFGRIGGEEFALVFPEIDISGAVEVAERVRSNLEQTAVMHNGANFFITASIGLGEYRKGDTPETLLHRADQAMYRAKTEGRNNICREA